MRTLIVEDDVTSRLLLQSLLSPYGECHIAVNGWEAVAAFRAAQESGQAYDLICMDIMMPEMDGQTAVTEILALEEARGKLSTSGVKIIMTTALDDVKNVVESFTASCDAYSFKPIDKEKLLAQVRGLRLVLKKVFARQAAGAGRHSDTDKIGKLPTALLPADERTPMRRALLHPLLDGQALGIFRAAIGMMQEG
jgi:two-component system chemotaxis response regulator CheY